MRKDTSAGVIAGAASGALVGFIFAVFLLVTLAMRELESQFKTSPILAPHAHTLLLIIEVFLIVMYVALATFFGAIAGLIFVKAVNKLPFHSTYVKALVPWVVLLILYTVLPPLIFRMSMDAVVRFVTLQFPAYALVLAYAILFAYLFNRWVNHQQPNTQPPASYHPSEPPT